MKQSVSEIKNYAIVASIAVLFTFVGIIIASGLGKTPVGHTKPSAEEGMLQETVVATSQSPFGLAIQRVGPAVVSITAQKVVRVRVPDFPFEFKGPWENFFRPFRDPESKKKRKQHQRTLGSGFIVDKKGHILTNNHVVAGAEGISVKLSDKRELKAEVIGTDPETDVALIKLKIDKEIPDHEIAKLGDSDKIEVGDWVVALGNPLGLERTATHGIVSAKGRSGLSFQGGTPSYQDFIQTDAAINYGNSGGPLMNIKGEVIGINTAITGNVQGQNFGFAIPINMVHRVMEQLMVKGKVVRGYLGMTPNEITSDLAEAIGLSATEGVLVATVEPDTPAEKGGLKVGDVIIRLAGEKIKTVKQFRMLVASHAPGEKLKMTVIRDGKKKELSFTLSDRAQYLKLATGESEGEETQAWMGMEVASVKSYVARSMGIKEKTGAVVIGVEDGSPAEEKGIRPGDVILQVGHYQIEDLEDYQQAVQQLKGSEKPVLFLIKRGTWTRFVALGEKQ